MHHAVEGRGPSAVARFLNPQSVAIVGMSTRSGTVGRVILEALKVNQFPGEIHLVGRSGEPVDGRPMLRSVKELPQGVDLAVFALPAAGVKEAVADCVSRKVGAALIFAAGFAESGERSTQEHVSAAARDGGLAIVGPNCLGYTNNVDGLMLHMILVRQAKRWVDGTSKAGIALVGQSGGTLGHLQRAIDARGLPLSYVITTGNEAGLDAVDFLEYLVDDRATAIVALYSEQIRRPTEFLAAVQRSRQAGKHVLVLAPGKSQKAKAATQSHTGSLTGDYDTMKTLLEGAGALVLNSMDQYMDVLELVTRFPKVPVEGPAIVTASGAFVALANDAAENMGFEFPELEPATLKLFDEVLPPFGNYGNPLDTTASPGDQAINQATRALLHDSNVGSLLISYPIHAPDPIRNFNDALAASSKPAVMVALGDTATLNEDTLKEAQKSRAVFWRSSDRALHALAQYSRYGKLLDRERVGSRPSGSPRQLGKGTQPEWMGKALLKAVGIAVPEGALAKTADEAVVTARKVGFPVALKAQAATLSHKTEAGGVVLNLRDGDAVHAAWASMMQNVRKAAPGVTLDGVLVEKMSPKGVELMVGARRDPAWGPVLLVGIGGIWVEALGDVQLLPSDVTKQGIVDALLKLRSAKLLKGFRGMPPVDLDSVASTVRAIADLMESMPSIVEIDVNPLMALEHGVIALDALIVTS